jgi:Flp pilus assembly protein protease CpaA
MIQEAIIILSIFALLVLFIASLFDIKTQEIPDNLSYSFIVGALGIRLLYSIDLGLFFFLQGVLGFLIMFVIALALYHFKFWGGGDSKLLMGLGATFGTLQFWNVPFLIVLFLNIILVGGVYGVLWGAIVYCRDFKNAKKITQKLLKKYKKERIIIISLGAITLVSIIFIPDYNTKILLAILALLFLLFFYLHIFVKVIHQLGFIEKVAVSRVTVGDWLAKDVKIKGKVICSSKEPCIDKKQIKALKRYKIKEVWIKKGIPFVPAMFLATLFTLFLIL